MSYQVAYKNWINHLQLEDTSQLRTLWRMAWEEGRKYAIDLATDNFRKILTENLSVEQGDTCS